MSFYVICDFCGETIPDGWLTLKVERQSLNRDALGHYHETCWDTVWQTVRLAEEYQGSIERIPVATGQAIAAKRRKHTRPEED